MTIEPIPDNDEPREAADFYTGRGPGATYLGTVHRGHPEDLDVWAILQSRGPVEYDQQRFLATVAGLDRPAGCTWPHPHTSSADTPWAYCWDKGTVYVYHYGVEVAQLRCNTHTWQSATVEHDGREMLDPNRREFKPKSVSQRWPLHQPRTGDPAPVAFREAP